MTTSHSVGSRATSHLSSHPSTSTAPTTTSSTTTAPSSRPDLFSFLSRTTRRLSNRMSTASPLLGASDRNVNNVRVPTIDLTSDGPEAPTNETPVNHQSASSTRASRLPNFNRPVIDLTIDDDNPESSEIEVTHERPAPRQGGGLMRPQPVEPHSFHQGTTLAFFRHSPHEPYPEISLVEPVEGGRFGHGANVQQLVQITQVRPRPRPRLIDRHHALMASRQRELPDWRRGRGDGM